VPVPATTDVPLRGPLVISIVPAERLDVVSETDESRAASGVGAADAVVAYYELERRVLSLDGDAGTFARCG
jgi:hypothetical protein